MPPRKSTRPWTKQRTAWHPLFVHVLRLCLPRPAYAIRPEHPLHHQPLRIDVVIRKRGQPAPGAPLHLGLEKYLGRYTLIELKGPTDRVRGRDLHGLLAYAHGFCAQQGIRQPGLVRLMVVASRLGGPFARQVERCGGRVRPVEVGVCEVEGLMFPLCAVETEEGEGLLRLFSGTFVKKPAEVFELLQGAERDIFVQVYEAVQQFKQDPNARMRYGDFEEFAMSMQEFIDKMLERLPAEERVKGLAAEERVKGLSPEKVMKLFPVEERLRGLAAEERLKGLSPEEKALLRRLLDNN